MRIRTRHLFFKVLAGLGVLNYLVFLYDVLLNESDWFVSVMIGFIVLILLALLLYIGVKPSLEPGQIVAEEELAAAPEIPRAPSDAAPEMAVEVVEIPKGARTGPISGPMEGPHHFQCPYCSRIFSLEASHLPAREDIRMGCPFCSNTIRVPARPKLVPGFIPRVEPMPTDQVAYSCESCGELLRFTAPSSSIRRALSVHSCSNCGSSRLARAALGA